MNTSSPGVLMASQLAASADYAVISGNLDSLEGQVQQPADATGGGLGSYPRWENRRAADRQLPVGKSGYGLASLSGRHQAAKPGAGQQDWLAPPDRRGGGQPGGAMLKSASAAATAGDKDRGISWNSFLLGLIALIPIAMLGIFMAQRSGTSVTLHHRHGRRAQEPSLRNPGLDQSGRGVGGAGLSP
jgi:hypothetical protein